MYRKYSIILLKYLYFNNDFQFVWKIRNEIEKLAEENTNLQSIKWNFFNTFDQLQKCFRFQYACRYSAKCLRSMFAICPCCNSYKGTRIHATHWCMLRFTMKCSLLKMKFVTLIVYLQWQLKAFRHIMVYGGNIFNVF